MRTERRARQRVPLASFVWYQPLDESVPGGVGAGRLAQACDVSEAGLGMLCAAPLAVGARVFVEVASPRASAVAEVVHLRPAEGGLQRVGLRLHVVPPNDLLALRQHCQRASSVRAERAVLLVDDDALFRKSVARWLQGHAVLHAGSLDEADQILRRARVGAVVTDNWMPGPSGEAVLRRAAELQPGARRLMLSAHPPDHLDALVSEGIVHAYISKTADQALTELARELGE